MKPVILLFIACLVSLTLTAGSFLHAEQVVNVDPNNPAPTAGPAAEQPLNSFADDSIPSGPQPILSLDGHPKYPANFQHFDYADPDKARKGGIMREGFSGA